MDNKCSKKCEESIMRLVRKIDKMSEINFALQKNIYKKNVEIRKLRKALKGN